MKFSISFKYSGVTFKNKETKETIAYDTKASEGNTFTFDNVDEDVVIGMLKGIKDKKASQLFAYDDLRTNFINTMARNKCKELYDKLDKGEWKIEDIAVSNITIKDVEFTKPTMNAREAITVESISRKNYTKGAYPTYVVKERLVDLIEGCPRENPMWADLVEILEKYYGSMEAEKLVDESRKPRLNGVVCINWEWSSEYGDIESGEEQIPVSDTSDETIKRAVLKFCNRKSEWDEVGGHCDNVYLDVYLSDYDMRVPEFLFDGSFAYGEIKWFDNNGKEEHKYSGETYMESRKAANESAEPVIFKKDKRNNEVIAFFPETMFDGSVNRGNIMSYAHNGQHGEASIEYFQSCKPCPEEEYADLLTELEEIYTDGLTVVKKANYGRGKNRRQMWPTRF